MRSSRVLSGHDGWMDGWGRGGGVARTSAPPMKHFLLNSLAGYGSLAWLGVRRRRYRPTAFVSSAFRGRFCCTRAAGSPPSLASLYPSHDRATDWPFFFNCCLCSMDFFIYGELVSGKFFERSSWFIFFKLFDLVNVKNTEIVVWTYKEMTRHLG